MLGRVLQVKTSERGKDNWHVRRGSLWWGLPGDLLILRLSFTGICGCTGPVLTMKFPKMNTLAIPTLVLLWISRRGWNPFWRVRHVIRGVSKLTCCNSLGIAGWIGAPMWQWMTRGHMNSTKSNRQGNLFQRSTGMLKGMPLRSRWPILMMSERHPAEEITNTLHAPILHRYIQLVGELTNWKGLCSEMIRRLWSPGGFRKLCHQYQEDISNS